MSEHTITLSEHTYQALLEVAEKQGLTPENWILSQLYQCQPEAELLSEKIGDLIGAIDSQVEPHHQRCIQLGNHPHEDDKVGHYL